jgi:hypothetical protein
MKILKPLLLAACFSFIFVNGKAQLKVDNTGSTYLKNGTFAVGNDAVLYFGDANHYIKGKFGYGVTIGTYGYPDLIKVLQNGGLVGIGMEPSYQLDVNGTIRGYNLTPSDKRIKRGITPLGDKANLLLKLGTYSYTYDFGAAKGGEAVNGLNGTKHFGFIAQELKEIFPELVYTDKQGYLAVDYTSIIPLLVESYKQQTKTLDEQNARIEKLEAATKTTGLDPITTTAVAKLYQNNPNPFSQNTEIKTNVPNEVRDAQLLFFDMQGTQIKGIQIKGRGEVSTVIQGSDFKAGMYLYSLIIDGKEIDTKKMILTNQ